MTPVHRENRERLLKREGNTETPWSHAPYPAEEGHAGTQNADDGVVGGLSNVGFWTAAFIIALVLPTYTSFMAGSLRLTVYRVFLVASFFPCVFSLFSGARNRLLPSDGLVLAYCIWAFGTSVYHEGMGDGLEAGGILVVESLGAYLLGRKLVKDKKSFLGLVAFLVLVVMCMAPFTLLESLTGKNLFGLPPSGMEPRYGFKRAYGTFDHPIIYGVFCASITGIGWYSFATDSARWTTFRVFRSVVATVAALASVSSGAMVALWIQWILIAWDRLTRNMVRRWQLFGLLLVAMYIAVDLLSNRTPMKVFLTYLTFSSSTAYGRLIIWEWGFHHNVLVHPILGIGSAEWVRPEWMDSTSCDNFWLVIMMRHGLPCFFFLALAVLYLLFYGPGRAAAQGMSHLYKGWAFTVIGLIVAGTTVHFWNALYVYFFFLLGAGAWFHNREESGA